eukprot:TRINITY_DN8691_c1_g1_i1.p1 TRINITY_DN8691_c1_g1~~TRINITY_DN8691_c1_g1_i1.p1  ORF type:complete len:1216 (-),score=300.93 TRINITY_DN8691_c1_g1_i1:144-3791(-)
MATAEVAPDIVSQIGLQGNPWENGTLDLNVASITDAILELSRRLQHEVAQREFLEKRFKALDQHVENTSSCTSSGADHKTNSRDADRHLKSVDGACGLSVDDDAGGDKSKDDLGGCGDVSDGGVGGDAVDASDGNDGGRGGSSSKVDQRLHGLSFGLSRLEADLAYEKRQHALALQSMSVNVAFQFDAVRREIADATRACNRKNAEGLETILVKAQEVASKEAWSSAQAALAKEADTLQQLMDKARWTLEERMSLLEDRLKSLSGSITDAASSATETAAAAEEAAKRSAGAASDARDSARTAELAAEVAAEAAKAAASSPHTAEQAVKAPPPIPAPAKSIPVVTQSANASFPVADDKALAKTLLEQPKAPSPKADITVGANAQNFFQDEDGKCKVDYGSYASAPWVKAQLHEIHHSLGKRALQSSLDGHSKLLVELEQRVHTLEAGISNSHKAQPATSETASRGKSKGFQTELDAKKATSGASVSEAVAASQSGIPTQATAIVTPSSVAAPAPSNTSAAAAPAAATASAALLDASAAATAAASAATSPPLASSSESSQTPQVEEGGRRGWSKCEAADGLRQEMQSLRSWIEGEMQKLQTKCALKHEAKSSPQKSGDGYRRYGRFGYSHGQQACAGQEQQLQHSNAEERPNIDSDNDRAMARCHDEKNFAGALLEGNSSCMQIAGDSSGMNGATDVPSRSDSPEQELLARLQLDLLPWLEQQVVQLIAESMPASDGTSYAGPNRSASTASAREDLVQTLSGVLREASLLNQTKHTASAESVLEQAEGSQAATEITQVHGAPPACSASVNSCSKSSGRKSGLGVLEQRFLGLEQEIMSFLESWKSVDARISALEQQGLNQGTADNNECSSQQLQSRDGLRMAATTAASHLALRDEQHRMQKHLHDFDRRLRQLQLQISDSPRAGKSAEAKVRTRTGPTDAESDPNHEQFYNALRGVQRESSINKGRLEDLAISLDTLRGQVDLALPQLLNALMELVGRTVCVDSAEGAAGTGSASCVGGAGTGTDAGTGGNLQSQSLHSTPEKLVKLRDLLLGGDESSNRRFITNEVLEKHMEELRKNFSGELSKLKQELLRLLSDKADDSDVFALNDRLRSALEHLQDLSQRVYVVMQSQAQHEESVDNAAIFRTPLMPGNCVSCNRRVDLPLDRRSPWEQHESQGSPWPIRSRVPSRQSNRPRRESSLPSISQDASPAAIIGKLP